jgi:hypothetical protein
MIEVDWRATFIDYIQEHKLSPSVDPKSAEATRILRRSKGYVLVGGNHISIRHTHEVCPHGGGLRDTPRYSCRLDDPASG